MKSLIILAASFLIVTFVVTASQLAVERPSRVRVPSPAVHTFKRKTAGFLKFF